MSDGQWAHKSMTYYVARICWNCTDIMAILSILMLSPESLSYFKVFVLNDNGQFYLICLECTLFRIAVRLKK